jgi:hypothetical protein
MDCDMPNHEYSTDTAKRLPSHQANFNWVTGKSFNYFFCPILHVDQQAELCMGHVINDACPDSFGGRVVQRKDVDSWYGRVFEADFTGRVRQLTMGLEKALKDPRMRRTIPIRLFVGDVELESYPDDGVEVPGHTSVEFEISPGVFLSRKVKKPTEKLEAMVGERRIEIGRNDSVAVFVTLIKSAFLTLFRELGYGYALSPGGKRLGHDILGKFFLQYHHENLPDVKKAAGQVFRPYVNMMRMIVAFEGEGRNPTGTVEDGLLSAAITPNHTIFALKVFLRTAEINYSVLAPFYDTEEGKRAFDDFLVNDCQKLTTRKCQIKDKAITIEQRVTPLIWPKKPSAFTFD